MNYGTANKLRRTRPLIRIGGVATRFTRSQPDTMGNTSIPIPIPTPTPR